MYAKKSAFSCSGADNAVGRGMAVLPRAHARYVRKPIVVTNMPVTIPTVSHPHPRANGANPGVTW